MVNKILLLLTTFGLLNYTLAQQTRIVGVTIHHGNGLLTTDGEIEYNDSVIVYAGKQRNISTGNIVNAKGKHVYPGLFGLNTMLGLNEIEVVRATLDFSETGLFNPNARTEIAYNTDSKLLPTALFNGMVYLQPTPSGGLISGQSSIMHASGWNWEDACVKADDGVHLHWPELRGGGDIQKQQEHVRKLTDEIEEFFDQAAIYCKSNPDKKNLRYEAMKGIFNGTKRLYVHVSGEEGIIRSILFVSKYPTIKMVLVGAEQAYKVTSIIKEHAVPVIINLTHKLPSYAYQDVTLPYKMPALLTAAGIKVAIANPGAWESRNVAFNAGTAAAYGLTKEQALQCITGNAADICGVENAGTLLVGKEATIILCDGDILDMKSCIINKIIISGKEVDLNGQQQQLNKKYLRKYQLEK